MGIETHIKGVIGELEFTTHLIKKGFTVLSPINPNSSYDIVIDNNGIFTRIQVKYCTPKNGILKIELDRPMRNTKSYQERGVDAMGAYDSVNQKFYLIPTKGILNKTAIWIRIEKPKNTNIKKTHPAEIYEI